MWLYWWSQGWNVKSVMLVDLLGGLGMDDLGIFSLVVAHYYRCGWGSSSVCQVQFCVHHSLIILILFFYTSSLQLQFLNLEHLTFLDIYPKQTFMKTTIVSHGEAVQIVLQKTAFFCMRVEEKKIRFSLEQ